jgi:hypothetical protein
MIVSDCYIWHYIRYFHQILHQEKLGLYLPELILYLPKMILDDFLLALRSLAEFDLHLPGLNFWQKKLVFSKPLLQWCSCELAVFLIRCKGRESLHCSWWKCLQGQDTKSENSKTKQRGGFSFWFRERMGSVLSLTIWIWEKYKGENRD